MEGQGPDQISPHPSHTQLVALLGVLHDLLPHCSFQSRIPSPGILAMDRSLHSPLPHTGAATIWPIGHWR